jgi:hypothetical protein
MSPLSANAVESRYDLLLNNYSTTDARSQNRAKHHTTTGARAIDCLRDGKAVRIVFEPNRLP